MMLIVAVLIGLLPIAPAVLYFFQQRRREPTEAARTLVYGLNGFNALLGLMAAGAGFVWLFSPEAGAAAGHQQATVADPYATLAGAISTSPWRSAWLGAWTSTAAALVHLPKRAPSPGSTS